MPNPLRLGLLAVAVLSVPGAHALLRMRWATAISYLLATLVFITGAILQWRGINPVQPVWLLWYAIVLFGTHLIGLTAHLVSVGTAFHNQHVAGD